MFSQLGIDVLDTDIICRQITYSGSEALMCIARHFGKSILYPNGELNRRILREIIFNDPNARLWLEKILHPIIQEKIKILLQKSSSIYTLLVVPLLIEREYFQKVNRLLAIITKKKKQILRVSQRDKISKEQVKKILNIQASPKVLISLADDVVYNTVSDTNRMCVEYLHSKYIKLAFKHIKRTKD